MDLVTLALNSDWTLEFIWAAKKFFLSLQVKEIVAVLGLPSFAAITSFENSFGILTTA